MSDECTRKSIGFDHYTRKSIKCDELSKQVVSEDLKKFYRRAALGFMAKAVRCLRPKD